MLLTGGQVGMALSSSIVFICTTFLFLAGYFIQQRTVQTLQEALRPRLPAPPPSADIHNPTTPQHHPSRAFGGSLGSHGRVAYQQYLEPQTRSRSVDWTRLAHVQVVKDHHDVCNAIMLFGDLHRMKSPAKRVLMFPRAWAMEQSANKGDVSDPYLDTSRRLLRLVARRYRAELRPFGSAEGLASTADVSLASLYDMQEYDRLMILATPGLIMNATTLDSVLAYAADAPVALLQENETTGVQETDLMMAMPSSTSYEALNDDSVAKSKLGLGALPPAMILGSSSDEASLVSSIGSLHDVDRSFNMTAYLSSMAYVRFSDPKLPGPEYDVLYSDRVKARPKNKNADWIWTKLYGEFAQRRMDACGLDLEPWRMYQ